MGQNERTEAFPLHWPAGFPRTPVHQRGWGRFGRSMTPGRCQRLLVEEVMRLGGTSLIISTNVELRRDGMPYANRRAPADVGVAIYFDLVGKPTAMACDIYDQVHKNMRGLTLSIYGLRQVDRHGGGVMLERAFQGFAALPSSIVPAPPWWDVLGWLDDTGGSGDAGFTRNDVMEAYRRRAKECHPDRGGTDEQMADLNRARDEGLRRAS